MDYFVHGLFRDEERAARAVQSFTDADYDAAVISALMRAHGEVEEDHPTLKTGVGPGAALGAALGAVGTAVLASGGWLVAGPLLAFAVGGAAGAAAGALGGLSRWKEEIDFPEDREGGMILVGVSVEERGIERARAALARAEPERIHVSRKGEACREVETGVLSEAPDGSPEDRA